MIKTAFQIALVLCLATGLTGILLPAEAHESESHIKVPVVAQKIPPGIMITGPPFQGIEIHVRGQADLLRTLPELKLQYVLDLSIMKTGKHTVPVLVSQLNLPQELSVVSIQPQSIQVCLETESKKEVEVTVCFKGTPAPGYVVAKTAAAPSGVFLRGPKRIVDKIEKVSTHPIDVHGVSESFKKEITLDLSEDLEVEAPKTPILAEVTISEEVLTKRLTGIAVQGNDSQHGYEITPPTVVIDVKGPAKILETMSSATNFRVYVDIKGLDPGVYVRRASLELPVEITLISVSPEIFTVRIME